MAALCRAGSIETGRTAFRLSPKSSPKEGERQQKPRKMRRLKNHANIEYRREREPRNTRNTRIPSSSRERVWIFRVFRVFRGSKNSLGEDLGVTFRLAPVRYLGYSLNTHDDEGRRRLQSRPNGAGTRNRTLAIAV